jgi:molybdopterin/thiamine biosynthesis adenylyltransferase
MDLESLAVQKQRSGRVFRLIEEAQLQKWALAAGLTPRQAAAAALKAGIFPECYERNFPALTVEEQQRLFDGSVLVAGLGGLGGCQAQLLARAGVGRLLLADGDVFTPANLNRQLFAAPQTLGRSKAEVTARFLQDLAPALLIEPIPHYLDQGNLGTYLPRVQVVLDALDSAAARRLLLGAAREARVPLVHGAVSEKYGQVATILPEDVLDFAHLYPHQEAHDGAPPGILAPTVTLVASLQVQEALRLLLGRPPVYRRQMAHFDGDTGLLELLSLR